MTDSELAHQIISLLKRSPLTLAELSHALRPSANIEQIANALITMEGSGIVRYLPAVGLYTLGPEA